MALPRLLLILAPLGVTNQAMQVDGVKGLAPCVLQPQHNHAGHPEEEDVVARLHDRRGVEVVQIISGFRPAQCRVGPQP